MPTDWAEVVQAEAAPAAFRPGALADRFVMPPFSVLDTRKGEWQERRRAWLSLGIRSELGRGGLVYDEDGNPRDRSAPGGSLLPSMGGEQDENGRFKRGRSKAYEPPKGGLLGLAPAEKARERWGSNPANAAAGGSGADLMGPMRASFEADGEAPPEDAAQQGGTSIFDPVLCELAYRWFAPEGGSILDPFAGGSVRGIVASMLGHAYTGIDLSGDQLAENRKQARLILAPELPQPSWVCGDSTRMADLLPAGELYDMVWTCPPYFDLEVYSDDPSDLSAMDWPTFIDAYQKIIAEASARLRPGRFAGVVISEVRDKLGFYRGLVPLTIHAFALAGLRFYNEAILVNAAGSLPLRAAKYMEASRKLGRAHQNVLIFLKGDPPRGWSYDRAAPPSPQLGLGLDEPTPAPAAPSAEPVAEAEPVAAPEPSEAHGPPVAGTAPEPELTPVERIGRVWLKRDDLFEVGGARGGKARSCLAIAERLVAEQIARSEDEAPGLVTAGSRSSPQVNILARIARELGARCRVHVPTGELGPEVSEAQALGAEVVQHAPGYNSVIVARARDDAAAAGWGLIPFGMECADAVEQTAGQVDNIPPEVERIVVPVGSGMSLAGILTGLERAGRSIPVLGVIVGADPEARLDKWAPPGWRDHVELVRSAWEYHQPVEASIGSALLDPVYEAKCAEHLRPGDLLWIVGLRPSLNDAAGPTAAQIAEVGAALDEVYPDEPELAEAWAMPALSDAEAAILDELVVLPDAEERAEVAAELAAVAAGDTVDHADGYLADRTTGEVLEYPPGEPAPERPAAFGRPSSCTHPAGFHRGSLEQTACDIGGWWEGWPSVIPPGPPGSGTTAPPKIATLWATSDEPTGGTDV